MSRPCVLVVDDNPDNREYARVVLSDAYEVQLAGSGSMALDVTRTRLPDLILLDVSLPGRDGWGVLRELRDDPHTARLPVVACTAHALAGDRERGLLAGFDAYLSKPYRPHELLELVSTFLGPGAPGAGEAWELADSDEGELT